MERWEVAIELLSGVCGGVDERSMARRSEMIRYKDAQADHRKIPQNQTCARALRVGRRCVGESGDDDELDSPSFSISLRRADRSTYSFNRYL